MLGSQTQDSSLDIQETSLPPIPASSSFPLADKMRLPIIHAHHLLGPRSFLSCPKSFYFLRLPITQAYFFFDRQDTLACHTIPSPLLAPTSASSQQPQRGFARRRADHKYSKRSKRQIHETKTIKPIKGTIAAKATKATKATRYTSRYSRTAIMTMTRHDTQRRTIPKIPLSCNRTAKQPAQYAISKNQNHYVTKKHDTNTWNAS
jgi:hypothetical protein